MKGTSTPFSVAVSLAVLKLPTGALTALLGLLLMRGGFVPGLSALDTSAQILAWAMVFGYAQQLLTRMVDDQGSGLLNRLGGRGAGGERGGEARGAGFGLPLARLDPFLGAGEHAARPALAEAGEDRQRDHEVRAGRAVGTSSGTSPLCSRT